MQRSKQQDSDGSGSVVSLQSSSSDDGKYAGINGRDFLSEGAGLLTRQVDSPEEIGVHKEAGSKSSDNTTQQNMGKLQQKLNTQPTHNTLDEIISTLKTRNGIKNSRPGTALPLHNDTIVGGKTYNSSLGWNSSPLQMSGHQKFNEKYTRQLKDITSHFEAEIDKICEQLSGVGSSLTALQEALPVRMLEAANRKLEARCNVLEQVCEQMKNKSVRLEQANQELDANCGQLRQINQNLEVRCLYLEQVTKANESEKSNLHENVRDLETKVLELADSNEKVISACQQLEELNQKSANRNQQIEESKSLLEQRYKSCVGDNQKLEAQIVQYQKALEESKKRLGDCEEVITKTKREKEALATKLELLNKGHMQLKQKYEELKAMSIPKDELIARLENEMRELSGFVEKTIKEKAEAEANSKRDKDLLQRMLVEYDVLARDHQDVMNSSKAIHDKLDLSQSEMTSLRETISKLVHRNNVLEETAKESFIQECRRVEQLTGKHKPFTGRKTWDQSTPLKKRDHLPQYQLASYPAAESGRDSLGSELAGCQLHDSTLATPRMSHSVTPDATKVSALSGRRLDFSSSGAKSSSPASQARRKSLATKESPDSGQASPYGAPAGMVVKKTDLLTRFDVVFEDSKSGEEMVRTHTGRTRRLYGEPAQTEASFATGADEATGGIADSAFSSVQDGRDGRLLAVNDWESNRTEPRRSKSKQSVMYNVAEKDFGVKTGQSVNRNREEEHDQDNIRHLERKFSVLTEERKRLESTLSRIPTQKGSKRTKEDKAYLENRLYDVVKDIGTVRDQLRKQNLH